MRTKWFRQERKAEDMKNKNTEDFLKITGKNSPVNALIAIGHKVKYQY